MPDFEMYKIFAIMDSNFSTIYILKIIEYNTYY